MISTIERINLERGSSSGQDKYISQPINKQTTERDMPANGGGKKSPSIMRAAIKTGTKNLFKEWMRSNNGALASVTDLRRAEWVTTGTAGVGFFGFFG